MGYAFGAVRGERGTAIYKLRSAFYELVVMLSAATAAVVQAA